jgi:hypothetical protein
MISVFGFKTQIKLVRRTYITKNKSVDHLSSLGMVLWRFGNHTRPRGTSNIDRENTATLDLPAYLVAFGVGNGFSSHKPQAWERRK